MTTSSPHDFNRFLAPFRKDLSILLEGERIITRSPSCTYGGKMRLFILYISVFMAKVHNSPQRTQCFTEFFSFISYSGIRTKEQRSVVLHNRYLSAWFMSLCSFVSKETLLFCLDSVKMILNIENKIRCNVYFLGIFLDIC